MTVPDFTSAKILVVGDVMLDRYWRGVTHRISPEAPVPVVQIQCVENRLGGAGNVALNAVTLGARTTLCGLVGTDSEADTIEALLSQEGIQAHLRRVNDARTTLKLRVISQQQQLIRLDFEDLFPQREQTFLIETFSELLADADVIVLSDYGKGTLQRVQTFIDMGKIAGKKVIVDPKGRDFRKYAGAFLLTPNQLEFEAVAGSCSTEREIESRGRELREQLELEALLITRGAVGMTFVGSAQIMHLPAQAKEVYDVTGAGDTVVATLAASLGVGMSLEESVGLANMAAGIVVGKLGTAQVRPNELYRAMPNNGPM